jgi:hypothetical protein
MLNSKLMAEQSQHLAASLLADSSVADPARVALLYERTLGRPPSDTETARALAFIDRYESALDAKRTSAADRRARAWRALCRSILASSEFIYVE